MSVAVHYRNSPDHTAARSELSQALTALAAARGLEIREGKMVLEIGPGAGVNKGTAVRQAGARVRVDGGDVPWG